MPLSPVVRSTFYGIPTDIEVECTEHSCISIPGLKYVRVQVLVMYDVGSANGPIIQEFLSIHVRRNGVMLGMLRLPSPDA
ncbi:hypothetical protein EUGRSUZ_B01610 [Eucalyptus grandis]|uniref:Uncharacterized protein n=2 Tax=Eucalyptus grandis TaxID=71139 RepID=A0ACC3LRV0_EUCGR|nr:hypothetical protein EUGRSUZ_B01610 [Eucalyptus grandis]